MEVISTEILDIKMLVPKIHPDSRGHFFESFKSSFLAQQGLQSNFIQDNESYSKRGVIRGLHYQLAPMAQTKLVRAVRGKIWDVVVDLRKSSPTYLKWAGFELSEDNRRQLFVPRGFAHGFVVLSSDAVVQYKVDAPYSKDHERGVRFDDPEIDIQWPDVGEFILSDKDLNLPYLKSVERFD